MGQLDEQKSDVRASDPQAAEALLRSMIQDIENLRQNLLAQLSQDVERLQREKSQLIEDIEQLQAKRQQQIAQQQQLVKQIAPALANQLTELVMSQLKKTADASPVSNKDATGGFEGLRSVRDAKRSQRESPIDSAAGFGVPLSATASDYSENAYRLLASLDTTLRTTFRTLEQDLSSYKGSLAQQIAQMYSLEQQGEAILQALVSRLKEELQSESAAIKSAKSTPLPPATAPEYPSLSSNNGRGHLEENYNHSAVSEPPESLLPVMPLSLEPSPIVQPQLPPQPQPRANVQLGFFLALFSSLALAFQNVVITVIFNQSQIFGLFELGGFIAPSVGNSLLILWLRMLLVVPLLAILTTVRYPGIWQDIKQFIQSKDWPLYFNVLGSGFFLFLSQVLIYLALGTIAPGVAITVFFIYPIVAMLLAWMLFGDRPTLVRSLFILSLVVGFVLSTLSSSEAGIEFRYGVNAAAGAAIAFAIYIILTQACAKKLNPVPFSWINFVLILAFSSLSLAGPLPESWRFDVEPTMWPSLLISCLILGGTTLVSYLLNNIGIKIMGAAKASILGATVPVLTVILAWVLIQSTLPIQHICGMLLVTLGVAALSFERLRQQTKMTQQRK